MNNLRQALLVAAGGSLLLSPVWGTGSSVFLALAFVLAMVLLFLQKPKVKWIAVVPFWLMFAISLVGMMWTSNTNEGWRLVQIQLNFLFIPVVVIAVACSGANRNDIYRVLMISLGLSLILMGYDAYQQLDEMPFIQTINGSQLSLPFLHRAYFMNHVAILILLLLFRPGKLTWSGVLLIAILGLIFWILQGRMNLLALGAVLGLLAVWGVFKKNSRVSLISISVIGLLLASHFIGFMPSRFDQDMSNELETSEDGVPQTNSRLYMWEMSLAAYSKSPILGVGTGDTHDAINGQFEEVGYEFGLERNYNSHNQYVQMLLTYGPIGLLILLGMFVVFLIKGWKNRDMVLIAWTIYFGLVLLTESYFDRFHGVYLFAVVTSFLLATTNRE